MSNTSEVRVPTEIVVPLADLTDHIQKAVMSRLTSGYGVNSISNIADAAAQNVIASGEVKATAAAKVVEMLPDILKQEVVRALHGRLRQVVHAKVNEMSIEEVVQMVNQFMECRTTT